MVFFFGNHTPSAKVAETVVLFGVGRVPEGFVVIRKVSMGEERRAVVDVEVLGGDFLGEGGWVIETCVEAMSGDLSGDCIGETPHATCYACVADILPTLSKLAFGKESVGIFAEIW